MNFPTVFAISSNLVTIGCWNLGTGWRGIPTSCSGCFGQGEKVEGRARALALEYFHIREILLMLCRLKKCGDFLIHDL